MLCRINIIVLLSLLLSLPGIASGQYKEGTDYERLSTPVPTSSGDKIEVIEAFSYGCPHCFSFDPVVEKWLETKPDDVEFLRIPVIFGRKSWELFARTYYIAEELDIVDKIHQPFMDLIHVKQTPPENPQELADFFAAHGVEQAEFDKAFRSFSVNTKLRRAQELVRRYRIGGVPSLIVNGKYKTNNFNVVDYLIQKEKEAG